MSYYPHPQPFYGTIIESEYGLVGLVEGGSIRVFLADDGLCYPLLDEEGIEIFFPNSFIEETLPNGENSPSMIEELFKKVDTLSKQMDTMTISHEEKVLPKLLKKKDKKAKNSSKKASLPPPHEALAVGGKESSFPATAKASCGGGKAKKKGAKVATNRPVVIPDGIKTILENIASSDAEAIKYAKSVDKTPKENELPVMAFFMIAFFIPFPSRQRFTRTAYSNGPFFLEMGINDDKDRRIRMHIIVLRIFAIFALKTKDSIVSNQSITEYFQNVEKDPASGGAYRGKPGDNKNAFKAWCKSIDFVPATDHYSAMYPAAHAAMQEFATSLRVVQDRNFENPETKDSIDDSLAFCEIFLENLLSRK